MGDIEGLCCGPVDDDHQATLDPEADDILDFDQVNITRPLTPLVDSDGWELFLDDSVLDQSRQEDPNQVVHGYDYTIVPGNFSKCICSMYVKLHLSLIPSNRKYLPRPWNCPIHQPDQESLLVRSFCFELHQCT